MPKLKHGWIKKSKHDRNFYPVKIITEDNEGNVIVRLTDETNLTLLTPRESVFLFTDKLPEV